MKCKWVWFAWSIGCKGVGGKQNIVKSEEISFKQGQLLESPVYSSEESRLCPEQWMSANIFIQEKKLLSLCFR